MKYITPEIEINKIQTEDIMKISDALNGFISFVGGDENTEGKVDVQTGKNDGDIDINVGADFFGWLVMKNRLHHNCGAVFVFITNLLTLYNARGKIIR